MLTYGVSGTAAGSAAILQKLKDLVMLKFNDNTDKFLAYPTSVAGTQFTCFTSKKVQILTQKEPQRTWTSLTGRDISAPLPSSTSAAPLPPTAPCSGMLTDAF